MKRNIIIASMLALLTIGLVANNWYNKTVYSSSTVASTVTDTAIVSVENPNYEELYLESYYSGTGYVKTDVQSLVGGSWVTVIDDDSTGAEYGYLTLANKDTVRVRASVLRIINAITVSSGTSTFRQSLVSK